MNLSPTPKQAGILWFALTALAVGVVIALIAAFCWGMGRVLNLLSPVLLPLAIAGVVACVLSPVVDYFERRKISRVRAIILVFSLALAMVVGLLASVIPQVVVETEDLASKVPAYSQKIQERINEFYAHPPALLQRFLPAPQTSTGTNGPAVSAPEANTQESEKPMAALTTWVTAHLAGVGTWLLGELGKLLSGFGLLAGLVLVPVYTFHFLREMHGIQDNWRKYLPLRDSAAKDEVIFLLNAIGQYLVAFFRGQLLIAICDSILYCIGFLLIGLNYTYLLGCAAVVLIMIPFLGAAVICVAALLLALAQFGDWLHPLLVLVIFAIVQTLEGLFISPKIMGDRVGLHPVVIIIAVMTGTTLLGGILGGVLAIPLAAALRVILHRYVWGDEEAKS